MERNGIIKFHLQDRFPHITSWNFLWAYMLNTVCIHPNWYHYDTADIYKESIEHVGLYMLIHIRQKKNDLWDIEFNRRRWSTVNADTPTLNIEADSTKDCNHWHKILYYLKRFVLVGWFYGHRMFSSKTGGGRELYRGKCYLILISYIF